jgi:DNA modification methylase
MSIEKEIIGDATIYHGDCMEVLESLENIDSCVADPPYGLSFMGKQWDYDVPQKELWEKVYQSIKQGGHLLSFFGSRTYHRGVIPIEDSGFEIRDQLMWLYGSGFPKSHNIGKAVDKLQGNEREAVRVVKRTGKNDDIYGTYKGNNTETKGTSEYEGWGTALKPAHEPIVMARKPFKGSVAENVLEHGTAGINIDGCRIEGEVKRPDSNPDFRDVAKKAMAQGGEDKLNFSQITGAERKEIEENNLGRFPANVMHDGSDVVQDVFGDKSRYFYCAKASKQDRDEGLNKFQYKQSSSMSGRRKPEDMSGYKTDNDVTGRFVTERKNIHPTVKPTELMRYLCRLVTPKGGVVLDPFMGSGSTGKGALLEGFRFIGIEMEREYFDIACARLEAVQKNMQVSLFDEH